jgi:transcriptional regulator of arginine metabolism
MGKYRYVRSQREGHGDVDDRRRKFGADHHTHAITQVTYAINNVVVKTTPGMASAVALYLDDTYRHIMLGSVAGDDTIIIVTRNEEDSRKLYEHISRRADA